MHSGDGSKVKKGHVKARYHFTGADHTHKGCWFVFALYHEILTITLVKLLCAPEAQSPKWNSDLRAVKTRTCTFKQIANDFSN
jgi:hypothetical protein